MRTSAAVTGAKGIPVGYGILLAVYLCLGVVVVWVLRRIGQAPLDDAAEGAVGAR
jgi:cytochrome d ubiquinol oxidase subunit I